MADLSLKTAFATDFKAKNNSRMKFYLMWANHSVNYTWDIRNSDDQSTVIWDGAVDRRNFDVICRRLIEKFFSQPNYYKIDGCPVFMIYDLHNLVRGLGGVDETRRALDNFRDMTARAGYAGLHLQLTAWSEHAVNLSGVDTNAQGSTRDAVKLLGFDSISHYQFVHFVNIDRDYREILADVRREWSASTATMRARLTFPTSLSAGTTTRFTRFAGHCARQHARRLRKACAWQKSMWTPTLPACAACHHKQLERVDRD